MINYPYYINPVSYYSLPAYPLAPVTNAPQFSWATVNQALPAAMALPQKTSAPFDVYNPPAAALSRDTDVTEPSKPVSVKPDKETPAREEHAKAPNPFTRGIPRHGGFLNEYAVSLQSLIPAKIRNQIIDLSYQAVIVYCALDAGYVATEKYFQTKNQGGSSELAKAKAIQYGIGEGFFQFLASYYVPAEIIKRAVHPAGKILGRQITSLLSKQKNPGPLLAFMANLAKGNKSIIGNVIATGMSIASIPLMIKMLDPVFHKMTEYLWYRPSQQYIEKRYGAQDSDRLKT